MFGLGVGRRFFRAGSCLAWRSLFALISLPSRGPFFVAGGDHRTLANGLPRLASVLWEGPVDPGFCFSRCFRRLWRSLGFSRFVLVPPEALFLGVAPVACLVFLRFGFFLWLSLRKATIPLCEGAAASGFSPEQRVFSGEDFSFEGAAASGLGPGTACFGLLP